MHYRRMWENWSDFSSRSTRPAFWYPWLMHLIIIVVLSLLTRVTAIGLIASIVGMIYSLLLIVPAIAISIRRLHDIGRSGWWLLLWFLPIIGWIMLIVFFLQPSQADR